MTITFHSHHVVNKFLLCIHLIYILTPIYTITADESGELVSKVKIETLEKHVIALQDNITQFPTRRIFRTRNAHHQEATENVMNYIKSVFRSYGRLQVTEQNIGGIRNIIAELPPKKNASSKHVFIMCAYYDTKAVREPNWNPLASSAPGANRNGTGIAAMLAIAQILSQYEYDHTIKFIAFGGEELGFLGSKNYIHQAIGSEKIHSESLEKSRSPESEKITAVFNLDMLGYNWKSDLVEVIANRESIWISRALAIANTWHDIGLTIRQTQDEFVDISSHKTFWDAGYPAVTLIESSTPWRDSQNYTANPFYHTYDDTVDKINFPLVTKVTKLVLITVYSLLNDIFKSDRELPQVTLELPDTVNQNPLQITGTYETDYPIDIIIHPSKVKADLDKETHTYRATIPLTPGKNTLTVVAQFPLGAASVKQSVILDEAFVWKDVSVSPNPVRFNERTEFRVEGNLEITNMTIIIYDVRGNIIQRIEGIDDRLDKRIWRTWWNQQTVYGLVLSPGIYVCHISIESKGETYSIVRKLAIIR